MILNISEKDGIKAIFVNENKDNCKLSATGKSYSFMIGESASIKIKYANIEKTISGKDFMEMLQK